MMGTRRSRDLSLGFLLVGLFVRTLPAQEVEVSCDACHADQAQQFLDSIHAHAQMKCQDCHGGEQVYAISRGKLQSTSFEHGGSFLGKPSRFEIPEKCASCHSNVTMMNPYGLPANQLLRYRTSAHGKALYEKKNAEAAVCTDCHDVHAIYKPKDIRSRTYPVNVPETCSRCHADGTMMETYGHSTEIVSEYRRSVHGKGLLEEHDTGMPTCATCHGNHAAVPPGVESVNAVCGRCHIQADQLFLKSPHAQVSSFRRCVACHGGEYSHDIRRATERPSQIVRKYVRLGKNLEGDQQIQAVHPGLSLIREVCYECHDEDSDDESDVDAFKRSEELYRLIAQAEIEYAKVSDYVDGVGRGVLLVEDERLMMTDAKTALIELSPTQHTLSIDEINSIVERLKETTDQVKASLKEKEEGLAWRYQVLAPMWIFIVVFALASYIKYHRLREIHVKPLKQ